MSEEQLLAQFDELVKRGDQQEIDAFLAGVDALDAADGARLTGPGALAGAALWYAENGVAVFRLQPRDKKPFPGSRGFKDATTDLDRIRAWWSETPTANIGVPTGHGFDVIDVDPPEGPLSIVTLREARQVPEVIGKVITPRCGDHLYIRSTGDGNGTRLLPGVDYRGLGGYVVAPPSVGANGARYTWVRPLDLAALAEAA
jgi:hypothetical protein